jgi:hypothetical protein
MKFNVKQIALVSAIFTSGLNLALPLSVLASTWEGKPEVSTYEFNRNIGTTFIKNVEVKTGYYNYGTPNTEVTITFVPANCTAYTETNFTATLTDNYDGIPLTLRGSKTTYYGDTVELTLDKDIMTVDPGYLNLDISNECIGDSVSIESTYNTTVETIEENVYTTGDGIADTFYDITDALDPFNW